jgi:hypothetical protein
MVSREERYAVVGGADVRDGFAGVHSGLPRPLDAVAARLHVRSLAPATTPTDLPHTLDRLRYQTLDRSGSKE